MTDDRGIGIVMLLLKAFDPRVYEGGPSQMDGRRVLHPPMVQGQGKAYAVRFLLLSSMPQLFCSEGRERRGTSPPAVPDQEAELQGRRWWSLVNLGTLGSYQRLFKDTVLISGLCGRL